MKKHLILLSGLVASIGLSAQEKVVYQGMTMVVETAIIDSVDCSNEYFMKDVYIDLGYYVDKELFFSISGDVPNVYGKIEETHREGTKELDGETYNIYHFIWDAQDEDFGKCDVEYLLAWRADTGGDPLVRIRLITEQGKVHHYTGRLFNFYGEIMREGQEQQDSTEVE